MIAPAIAEKRPVAAGAPDVFALLPAWVRERGEWRTLPDGRCYLSVPPSDAALLAAARELALLAPPE